MAFDSTPPRNDYIGTGALDTYDYTFQIMAATDLRVTVRDTDGVESTLTVNTDYTVTFVGTEQGGTITLLAGNLEDDYALTIRWDKTPEQGVDLRNQGGLYLEVIEAMVDEVTRYVQANRDALARALHLPETEAGTDTATKIPSLVERMNRISGWDGSGNLIAVAGVLDGTVVVSSFGETLVNAANAAAARATLLAAGSGLATGSGLTQATARLLGRTTAATGAIEEITPDSSLTFAAGALGVAAATTVLAGKLELATQAEVDAGTPVRALTTDLSQISTLTSQSTNSGTAFDFTVPAGVTRVHIILVDVSLSGTDDLLIQVGDAGGIETSGYLSTSAAIAAAGVTVASSTAGFIIKSGVAANVIAGIVTLMKVNTPSNVWMCSHSLKSSATVVECGGGHHVGMADPGLTTIRLTRSGANTFDSGDVNVRYER